MTPDEPPSAKRGKLSIRIINRQRLAASGRKEIQSVLQQILLDHDVPKNLSIDISLVRDETIHPLNKKYRGKDQPTDVLAFPYIHPHQWSEEAGPLRYDPGSAPESETLIGEVLISTDQALKQAASRKTVVGKAIARLAVHGVLHLLGYDHDLPEAREEMRRMERRYLRLWTKIAAGGD